MPIEYHGELRLATEGFYGKYFEDPAQMKQCFHEIFTSEKHIQARRMLNQLRRFATLAIDMDKIKPGNDALKILHLRIGMKSIIKLAGRNDTNIKKNFLSIYMSADDKEYLLNHIEFLPDAYPVIDSDENVLDCAFSIEDIELILKEIRDDVVHEGDCWDNCFFAPNGESRIVGFVPSQMKAWSKRFPKAFDVPKPYIAYQTTLQADNFIDIYVGICLVFIKDFYLMTKA